MIRNIATIIRREFVAYFLSPIAYVMLVVALGFNGFVFTLIVDFLSRPDSPRIPALQMLFGGTVFFWLTVIFFVPVITMRLIAEERRSGTIETLMTSPVTDAQVILGKFFAAWAFYLCLWAPTLAYVYLLSRYGSMDPGPIVGGYLGVALVGGMFIAIGLLSSTFTRNQIVAAILAFLFCALLFGLGILDYLTMEAGGQGLLNYLNLWSHMEELSKGIVDTRRLVYYGSTTVFCLFLAVWSLEARRWRS